MEGDRIEKVKQAYSVSERFVFRTIAFLSGLVRVQFARFLQLITTCVFLMQY